MATIKWDTPSAQGSNIASTSLDSLANGSTSAFITYDNGTNRDLYGNIYVVLGSFTSTTGASVSLRIFSTADGGSDVPDATGGVGGGDVYTQPITVGASAKAMVFPMVRLYPFSLRICVTNNGGAAFASSGNTLQVQPFNESAA